MRDSEPKVDKTALTEAILAANSNKGTVVVSTDGSEVDPADKWVTQAEMEAYTDAIAAAQAIANKGDAIQAEVDKAVTDLGTATNTFNGAKKDGTKAVEPDVVTAGSIVGATIKQNESFKYWTIVLPFDAVKAKIDTVTEETTLVLTVKEATPVELEYDKDVKGFAIFDLQGPEYTKQNLEVAVITVK